MFLYPTHTSNMKQSQDCEVKTINMKGEKNMKLVKWIIVNAIKIPCLLRQQEYIFIVFQKSEGN